MENKLYVFWVGLFMIVLMFVIVGIVFWFNVDCIVCVLYDLFVCINVMGLFLDVVVCFCGFDVGKV